MNNPSEFARQTHLPLHRGGFCGLCIFHIPSQGAEKQMQNGRTTPKAEPPTRQSKVRSQVLSESAKPYHSLASPLPHKAYGLCGVPKSRKAFRGKEQAS